MNITLLEMYLFEDDAKLFKHILEKSYYTYCSQIGSYHKGYLSVTSGGKSTGNQTTKIHLENSH